MLWQSSLISIRIPAGEEETDSARPDIDGVAVEWTPLLAGTDYVGNSARDGSGTDLTSSLTVTPEFFATSADFTIENTGTQDVYLTTLQVRGKIVKETGDYEILRYAIDSMGKYGRRTYRFPASFMTDPVEAINHAEHLRDQLKDPHPKISLQVDANASDDLLEKAISLDVSDRVTLIADGVSHLGIDEDFYIEAIGHDIAEPAVHRTRYTLSSALASGLEKVIVLAPTPPASQGRYGPGLGTGALGR